MWDIAFHAFECNVLTACRGKDPILADYELHSQIRVRSAGYLGLTIQSDGRWTEHIEAITLKGNRLLGFLRRNLKIGSKAIKEHAYKMSGVRLYCVGSTHRHRVRETREGSLPSSLLGIEQAPKHKQCR